MSAQFLTRWKSRLDRAFAAASAVLPARPRAGRWALAGSLAAAIAACGGGSGGIDGSGVTPDSMSYGTVTAFGSVWVNGVRFDTSAAAFKLDDASVTQADLRVGMTVRVDGSITNGRADTVTVDHALKGRVEQVIDAARLVVMGQTVQIDAQTRFENNAVPVLDDYVEVHGLVVGDGVVAAGFIQKKTTLASPPFAVKGIVKNHNAATSTFQVGTLSVNYAGAVTSDLPAGTSWNGLQVDVKGSSCAGRPQCGTLSGVTKVEPAGARVGAIAKAEVEGFVTSLTASGFVLGSQAVTVSPSTVYAGGTAADIAVGVKLEAEGPIAGGVLTAAKVSFRENVRIEANIAAVNPGAGTLTIAGLNGLTVVVNANTRLKNIAGLSALRAGDGVRLQARSGSGSTVQAVELEQRSPGNRVILQGPISAVNGTTGFTILGVVIDVGGSGTSFKNLGDGSIDRAAFFAALSATNGTVVKVRGPLSGSTVTWDEAELED